MCTCTDMEDAVMGLRVAQCSQKPCEDSCQPVSGARRLRAAWGHRIRKVGDGISRRGKKGPVVSSGSKPERARRRRIGLGKKKEAREKNCSGILP